MSADNWTTCPRCVARGRDKADKELVDVMALYGKIPVREFDEKRAALSVFVPSDTFREDYEFYGGETGEVTYSYSGHCTECGLGVDFTGERRFWSPEDR